MALGIDLERGRPGHPQDNGGHERMHRDIRMELEPDTAEQAALDLWRQEFNRERPHEALGMKCPAEVYQHSGNGVMKALRRIWIIRGWTVGEWASTGRSAVGNAVIHHDQFSGLVGGAQATWPTGDWKYGLAGCCWAGLIPRRRASSGRLAARWKLVNPEPNV